MVRSGAVTILAAIVFAAAALPGPVAAGAAEKQQRADAPELTLKLRDRLRQAQKDRAAAKQSTLDKAGKAAQDALDEGKTRLEAFRARQLADKAAQALGYAVFRAKQAGTEVDWETLQRLVNALAEKEAEVQRLETQRGAAVDSAEAERRRIERDLHDGAQQRLVALAAGLGAAREKLPVDPEEGRRMVAEAHDEAKAALKEIRDLVRGIHPVILEAYERGSIVELPKGRSPERSGGVVRLRDEEISVLRFIDEHAAR